MNLIRYLKVTSHTKKVQKGSIFVAILGFEQDGAQFIPEAIKKGASQIIASVDSLVARKFEQEYKGIAFNFVENPRRELALQAAQAYNYPAKKLKIIGITGTKGKTTTSFLLEFILKKAGFKVALAGSIKNSINDTWEYSTRATMGSDCIQAFLNECVIQSIDYVILEVSSHAIALDRVYGITFDYVIFTTFAPDHLDFHPTVKHYFETKALLFNALKKNGKAILHPHNEATCELQKRFNEKALTPSQNFFNFLVTTLYGKFNALNIALASKCANQLGISQSDIGKILNEFPGIPGRLQKHVIKNGAVAYVDYAHEELSFTTVLKELRMLTNHLIVLFGCGHGRVQKRSVMGRVASQYANCIILTNDNPKHDDPFQIINDIKSGIISNYQGSIIVELDREQAIKKAASCSKSNSIIALLGKGHETYQLIKDNVFYFNDFEEISRY